MARLRIDLITGRFFEFPYDTPEAARAGLDSVLTADFTTFQNPGNGQVVAVNRAHVASMEVKP